MANEGLREREGVELEKKKTRIEELRDFIKIFEGMDRRLKEETSEYYLDQKVREKSREIFRGFYNTLSETNKAKIVERIFEPKEGQLSVTKRGLEQDDEKLWQKIEDEYYDYAKDEMMHEGGSDSLERKKRSKAYEKFEGLSDEGKRDFLYGVDSELLVDPLERGKIEDRILGRADFFDEIKADLEQSENQSWAELVNEDERKRKRFWVVKENEILAEVRQGSWGQDLQKEVDKITDRCVKRVNQYLGIRGGLGEGARKADEYKRELEQLEKVQPLTEDKAVIFVEASLSEAGKIDFTQQEIEKKRREAIEDRKNKILEKISSQEREIEAEIETKTIELFNKESKGEKAKKLVVLGQKGYEEELPWVQELIENEYLLKAVKFDAGQPAEKDKKESPEAAAKRIKDAYEKHLKTEAEKSAASLAYDEKVIANKSVDLGDMTAIEYVISKKGDDEDKRKLDYLKCRKEVVIFIDQKRKVELEERAQSLFVTLADAEKQELGEQIKNKFKTIDECRLNLTTRELDRTNREKARATFDREKPADKDKMFAKVGQKMFDKGWSAFREIIVKEYKKDLLREDIEKAMSHRDFKEILDFIEKEASDIISPEELNYYKGVSADIKADRAQEFRNFKAKYFDAFIGRGLNADKTVLQGYFGNDSVFVKSEQELNFTYLRRLNEKLGPKAVSEKSYAEYLNFEKALEKWETKENKERTQTGQSLVSDRERLVWQEEWFDVKASDELAQEKNPDFLAGDPENENKLVAEQKGVRVGELRQLMEQKLSSVIQQIRTNRASNPDQKIFINAVQKNREVIESIGEDEFWKKWDREEAIGIALKDKDFKKLNEEVNKLLKEIKVHREKARISLTYD